MKWRSCISNFRTSRVRHCVRLRGFKRVHLKPGESQTVHFELRDRDLSMVTEAGEPIIAKGKYSVSIGGGQPNTEAPSVSGTFQVKGTKRLPE